MRCHVQEFLESVAYGNDAYYVYSAQKLWKALYGYLPVDLPEEGRCRYVDLIVQMGNDAVLSFLEEMSGNSDADLLRSMPSETLASVVSLLHNLLLRSMANQRLLGSQDTILSSAIPSTSGYPAPLLMSRSTNIIPAVATCDDIDTLAHVLTRAFSDDPVAQWFVRQDERREERSVRLFRWFLNDAVPHGLTYTTPDRTGAALWIPPNQWQMPIWRQLILLSELVAVTGVRNMPSRILGVDRFQRLHPKKPHYYLVSLGVEPEHQGQGIGSALMKPVLDVCDSTGIPAYLETSKERNIPLYERHGFRLTGEVWVSREGPIQWLMWREPQN